MSVPPTTARPILHPSPLAPALALAWVSSLGTGVVTTGIYFIAEHAYGFTRHQNYLLALILGVTYVLGALSAGPLMRRLAASHRLSLRALLGILLVVLGVLCIIPLAAGGTTPGGEPVSRAQWPIWVLVILYSPLTGVLWPVVESFISGGRVGPRLRSATGTFNYTWASALVVGFALPYGLAALGVDRPLQDHSARLIAALGGVHVLSTLLLLRFAPEPGEHVRADHEPHPRQFKPILTTFRVLLPTSYVVLTALNPGLPSAMESLGVAPAAAVLLAATWTAARVVVFVALERWHGWHGRWYPAVVGGALMVGGFAMAVLAPRAESLALMLSGLAVFGVGMASIYTGALYYAMEVGEADVDAGGVHEALIGAGYTVGPLLGLTAGWAADRGLIDPARTDVTVLYFVGVVAAVAASVAAWRSWKAWRNARPENREAPGAVQPTGATGIGGGPPRPI